MCRGGWAGWGGEGGQGGEGKCGAVWVKFSVFVTACTFIVSKYMPCWTNIGPGRWKLDCKVEQKLARCV